MHTKSCTEQRKDNTCTAPGHRGYGGGSAPGAQRGRGEAAAAHRCEGLRRAKLEQARHGKQVLHRQRRLQLPAEADVEALQRLLCEAEMQAGDARAPPQAERLEVLQVVNSERELPHVGVALDAQLSQLPRSERRAIGAADDACHVPQRQHLHSTQHVRPHKAHSTHTHSSTPENINTP